MQHISLYRKYRPKNFEDVIGQDNIVHTLKNQVKNNEISHAYLFSGPRGTGKTSIAKILSRAINCNSNGTKPCNDCEVCKAIGTDTTLDVIEMDGASHNGVEDIREINEIVNYSPSICKYKVLIIDEVHMLSNSAFNALLKTLEEPLSHMVFILATTELHKIPATILSRCQRYEFRRISDKDMVGAMQKICLKENVNYETEALELIATGADGAMRDSLSMLEQVISYSDSDITYDSTVDLLGLSYETELLELLTYVLSSQTVEALDKIAEFRDRGRNAKNLLDDFSKIVNKITKIFITRDASYNHSLDMKNWFKNNQDLINIKKMIWIQNKILTEDYRYTSNHWILLESLLIRLTNMYSDMSKDAILVKLEDLNNQITKLCNILPQKTELSFAGDGNIPKTENQIEENCEVNYKTSHKTKKYDIIDVVLNDEKPLEEKQKNQFYQNKEIVISEEKEVIEIEDINSIDLNIDKEASECVDDAKTVIDLEKVKLGWKEFLNNISKVDGAVGSLMRLTNPYSIDDGILSIDIEDGFDFIEDELKESDTKKIIIEQMIKEFSISEYRLSSDKKTFLKSNIQAAGNEISETKSVSNDKKQTSNLDDELRLSELFESLGDNFIVIE